jgi:hypothetical protein
MEVTDEVRTQIIAALTFLPENSEIRVRANQRGRFASPTEEWVAEICRVSGTDLHSFHTDEGCKAFERDRQMVEGTHRVIAFFPEERFMEGGTGHVVQCALEAEVPTEAWAQTDDGLELIAENDERLGWHTSEWLKTRKVAEMVLKFRSSAPSWPVSPKRSSSSTSTGFTSTALTGGVKFRPGSTKRQPPLALAAHPRSPRSSSPTSGTSTAGTMIARSAAK